MLNIGNHLIDKAQVLPGNMIYSNSITNLLSLPCQNKE